MPSDFENRFSQLLHHDADRMQPLSSTDALLAGMQARQADGSVNARRWQRSPFPLVATVCTALIVALLVVLFQAGALHRNSVGGSACPPYQLPSVAYTTPPSLVTYQGVTFQVTNAYVGFDFIKVTYSLTGTSVALSTFNALLIQPYVRDTSGNYAVEQYQDASYIPNGYAETAILAPFAQLPPAGLQTFVLGITHYDATLLPVLEVAFQAQVVPGRSIQQEPVTALVHGISVQVADIRVSQNKNPLINGLQSLRVHLRIMGMPRPKICATSVLVPFQIGYNPTDRQLQPPDQLWWAIGDQSTLTFADGPVLRPNVATLAPVHFRDFAPDFSAGLLSTNTPGQVDAVLTFYTPQLPAGGTLTFTLNQLNPRYITAPLKVKDYHYAGPWMLTIPLSAS